MVTVVNNPPVERERVIESDSSAGWAVAVIILLALIVGGAYWYTHRAPAAAPQQPGANIQVNLPAAGVQPDNSGGAPAATPAY